MKITHVLILYFIITVSLNCGTYDNLPFPKPSRLECLVCLSFEHLEYFRLLGVGLISRMCFSFKFMFIPTNQLIDIEFF
jgi:hypothetical protein